MTLPSSRFGVSGARYITAHLGERIPRGPPARRGGAEPDECYRQARRVGHRDRRRDLCGDRALHRSLPDQRAGVGGRDHDGGGRRSCISRRSPRRSRATRTTPGSPTTGWTPTPATGATTRRSCFRRTRSCTSRSTSTTPRPGCATRFFSQPAGTVGPVLIDGKPTSGGRPDDARPHVRDPADRPVGPAPGRSDATPRTCAPRRPCSLSQAHRHDLVRVPHAGQGAVPLAVLRTVRRRVSSRATAARCRPSAIWAASSRSYDRQGRTLSTRRRQTTFSASRCCGWFPA